MKKMNLKKGFTLIELLVVVAIIGILASVVLASLTSARSKGKDAAIFAQLSNARAQAELYYASNNNYGMNSAAAGAGLGVAGGATILPGTNCTANNSNATGTMFGTASTSSGLQGLIFGACSSGATAITAALNSTASTTVGATAWAVKATAVSSGTFYCVDSTGASKTYASDPTIATAACP